MQLTYGRVLKQNEKYKEAIEAFDVYMEEESYGQNIARAERNSALKALQWSKSNTNIKIYSLDNINSSASDFAPVLYKNDQLVFTSARREATGEDIYDWTGEKFGDIFVAKKKDKHSFGDPSGFSNIINTKYYEGTVAFSSDYNEIFYSYCPVVDVPQTSFCQIYNRRFIGGGWTDAKLVEIFEDTANIGHPFLTADRQELWFSTDFEGGFGGKDLYYVKKQKDGSWSPAFNAGRKINTPKDEMYPHIDAEGTLYFASNGHGGMGGLDIYSASFDQKRKRWTKVKNMRYPINSGADDFALVMAKLKT